MNRMIHQQNQHSLATISNKTSAKDDSAARVRRDSQFDYFSLKRMASFAPKAAAASRLTLSEGEGFADVKFLPARYNNRCPWIKRK